MGRKEPKQTLQTNKKLMLGAGLGCFTSMPHSAMSIQRCRVSEQNEKQTVGQTASDMWTTVRCVDSSIRE